MHEKAGVEDEWMLTLSSRSTGSVSWKRGAEKGSAMGLQIRDWHSLVLLCRQRKSVDLRELLAVAVEAAVLGGKEVKNPKKNNTSSCVNWYPVYNFGWEIHLYCFTMNNKRVCARTRTDGYEGVMWVASFTSRWRRCEKKTACRRR